MQPCIYRSRVTYVQLFAAQALHAAAAQALQAAAAQALQAAATQALQAAATQALQAAATTQTTRLVGLTGRDSCRTQHIL